MASDRILANVPRLCEQEPGYRAAILLTDRPIAGQGPGVVVARGPVPYATGEAPADEATALLEPVSRRWMGAPKLAGTFTGPADWSADGTELVAIDPQELAGLGAAGGVQTKTEAADGERWRVHSLDNLALLRGFVVAVYPYQPDIWSQAAQPLAIEWGGVWRLELAPTETGAGVATLYRAGLEHVGEWLPWGEIALIAGDYYNTTHKLWIQPLAGDEFLLRVWDDPLLGVTVRGAWEEFYDISPEDAGLEIPDGTDPDEMEPPPPVQAPWGPAPLAIEGAARAFVVVSHTLFPAEWELESAETADLGYETSRAPDVDCRAYLPPVGLAEGAYVATLTVETPEGEPFDGDPPARGFRWQLAAAGPADETIGARDWSHRAITVDRLQLEWPLTTADDGLTAVDLATLPEVGIEQLVEARTVNDADASLTITIDGPHDTIHPWCRPNVRWQWWIDGVEEGVDHLRFDGIRSRCEYRKYVGTDGSYYATATLTLRNRWRQADLSIYRGSIPLDGLTRAEAYRVLARQIPLAEAEIDITDLDNDEPLPSARAGDQPAFLPRIGADVGSVLRELHATFGGRDRIAFVENVFTAAPRDDETVRAAFYRRPSDVPPPPPAEGEPPPAEPLDPLSGTPSVVIGGEGPVVFTETTDDAVFTNDLWVIGRDRNSPADGAIPVVAYMIDPSSWQDASSPLYVNQRRTMVVQRPEINTLSAAVTLCRDLWREFHRFVYAAEVQGTFSPRLYPGDPVVLDPGDEPDAVQVLCEMQSMSTRLLSWSLPWERRYQTVYELRLVNESWVPPEEPEE